VINQESTNDQQNNCELDSNKKQQVKFWHSFLQQLRTKRPKFDGTHSRTGVSTWANEKDTVSKPYNYGTAEAIALFPEGEICIFYDGSQKNMSGLAFTA